MAGRKRWSCCSQVGSTSIWNTDHDVFGRLGSAYPEVSPTLCGTQTLERIITLLLPSERRVVMESTEKQNLERVLESALVVSWPDLMHGTQTGLFHIEYGFASDGTLENLKCWSSITRGTWLLACEYWMSSSKFHNTGIHFENGYESEGLSHILDAAMQHQSAFVLPENLGRRGLLQIPTPSQEQNVAALVSVNQAMSRVRVRSNVTAMA